MFRKILIANRGEIACRIMATAQRMGIRTVAVYSDADAEALHVRRADEAVRIGPPKAAESYLDIARIVAACKETGAEAVHPGYGFLSENEDFAAAIEGAGIAFIGLAHVERFSIGVAIDGDRLDAHALRRRNDAAGDLAAIGDEDFLEHAIRARALKRDVVVLLPGIVEGLVA